MYLSFLAVVCRLGVGGGAQVGRVARHGPSLLLIGRLGGGQILTHLLPLSLLDVVPGRVLQVSLHLWDTQQEVFQSGLPRCTVGNVGPSDSGLKIRDLTSRFSSFS